MKLQELKNKNVMLLGFGKEGIDSFLALRKLFPQKIIGVADKLTRDKLSKPAQMILRSDKKVKLHLGEDYLKRVGDYEVIIKTPGIPHSTVKRCLKKAVKITSQTEIFFDNFPGLIVGVTGTKGKGTTSGLIYHILKKADKKVHWLGNVGNPVFQLLLKLKGDEIIVYELSSHQLQGLKKSPHIAVFLNLFCDHLDYYKNLKEYQRAKENITLYQGEGDWLVYNADDKKVKQIAQKTKAKKLAFGAKSPVTYFERSLKIGYKLKGEFNWLNLKAALLVGQLLKISKKAIKEAVETFKPLPHRLEFVGKHKGVDFYDDSMATIPEVTIAALNAFKGRAQTLVLGGSDKGSDYKELAKEILNHKVKTLIVLSPGTGERIQKQVKQLQNKNKHNKTVRSEKIVIFEVGSMKEAVKIAYEKTGRGEVCLLSPGAASFNLFRDYKERGDLFKKWVKYYGKKQRI